MEFLAVVIVGVLALYIYSKKQVRSQYEEAGLLVRLEEIEQALRRIEKETVDGSYELKDEVRAHHDRSLSEFERVIKRVDSLEGYLLECEDRYLSNKDPAD